MLEQQEQQQQQQQHQQQQQQQQQQHPLIALFATAKYTVWSPLTLRSAGLKVLLTPSVHEKAHLTFQFVEAWKQGIITLVGVDTDVDASGSSECQTSDMIPDKPSRPVIVQDQSKLCNKKTNIQNTIHGIAHAESYAIELFWDAIARFTRYQLPVAFYNDMVCIAGQEASHFLAWSVRLNELGCPYGSLPTHDGLWRDAEKTSHSLLARLAIINMLHEARGLDVFPLTLKKFQNNRDAESVRILEKNFNEEIFHVATGVKWFTYLCNEKSQYNAMIETEFDDEDCKWSMKKETLNMEARAQAGMTNEWLEALYS